MDDYDSERLLPTMASCGIWILVGLLIIVVIELYDINEKLSQVANSAMGVEHNTSGIRNGNSRYDSESISEQLERIANNTNSIKNDTYNIKNDTSWLKFKH